jgi:hypothetical protein
VHEAQGRAGLIGLDPRIRELDMQEAAVCDESDVALELHRPCGVGGPGSGGLRGGERELTGARVPSAAADRDLPDTTSDPDLTVHDAIVSAPTGCQSGWLALLRFTRLTR